MKSKFKAYFQAQIHLILFLRLIRKKFSIRKKDDFIIFSELIVRRVLHDFEEKSLCNNNCWPKYGLIIKKRLVHFLKCF